MGQNVFSPLKLFLFETFVSNDLLGLEEKKLSFAQKRSKNIVDSYKILPDLFHVR